MSNTSEMTIDFKCIDYLKNGNEKQQHIYNILTTHQLLQHLAHHHPIVVGTFPLGIDIENSDVDIIVEIKNRENLKNLLKDKCSTYAQFNLADLEDGKLLCHFEIEDIPFEIYAADQLTTQQFGYLHLLKEYEILQHEGEAFRQHLIALKREGLKTEPAFCHLLGISGDPYIELLNYTCSKYALVPPN